MDEETKIKQDILLSIYEGNETYNSIRTSKEPNFHPNTLKKYLPLLAEEGLTTIYKKDWKKGKSKPSFITEAGINWLINNSLIDFLKIFSTILDNLIKPKNRKIFQKIREERYSRTISLVETHFKESAKKGVDPFKEMESLDEWEYKKRFKKFDLEKPLLEALKKVYTLIMYFWSNDEVKTEDIEREIDTHFIIFGKKMWPWFSYRPGSRPTLDSELQQIENEFMHARKSQSKNLKK